jgi:AcrR family transcriptional regulator
MPRARAPKRRTAETLVGPRERLLAAANDLFYNRGIRNVGIDEIIATAGVAKASLYAHFASKDELVAEYVRRRAADWWSWFHDAIEARGSTPKARLLGAFDVLAEWLADAAFRGCALQNACVELADASHAGHRLAATHKRALKAYLADLATQAGVRHPRAMADQLALLLEGAIVSALVDHSATPARTARAAAEALLRAS